MRGLAQLFWAAAAAFCLWRGERSLAAAETWRQRHLACERRARGEAEARR